MRVATTVLGQYAMRCVTQVSATGFTCAQTHEKWYPRSCQNDDGSMGRGMDGVKASNA